jgi:ATP-dependent Clp protease ATP-binding subunit ClpB
LEAAQETEDVETTLLRSKVGEEEIAEVVAAWTGIPVAKMLQGEREKLLAMEDNLHRRVIGQHQAISAVADAIEGRVQGYLTLIVLLARSYF